jgi:cytochrome c oxidase subunit 2
MQPQLFMPHAGTALAEDIDKLFVAVTWLSAFLFVLIVGAAAYWTYKHRRQPGDEKKLSTPTYHNPAIEIFWSVGPLLVCLGLFHWGVVQYFNLRVAPAGAEQVNVRGRKWAWEFEYSNGKVSDKLYAPVGKPVRLIMTSQDVIHSFFVPDFRIKQDVIPGRYSTVWFEAREVGENQVFCTEYCGNSHSDMLTKVVVKPVAEFEKWKEEEEGAGLPLAEVGKNVYEGKACNTCHSLDGSAKVGPSFKGLWGRQEALADGTTVTVDENYVRESVLQPNAKVVKGYQPVMPTFQGSLKERQILGIIEFLKAQKLRSETNHGSYRHRRPGGIRGGTEAGGQLSERHQRLEELGVHDRPQAHRPHVPGQRLVRLLPGRDVRDPSASRAAHAGQDVHRREDVQPVLHASRRDHGVCLHHPGHPGRAGELHSADPGGREGRRLPEAESTVVLRVRAGRAHRRLLDHHG